MKNNKIVLIGIILVLLTLFAIFIPKNNMANDKLVEEASKNAKKKVTDYKKIWGLKNIERGECDISYTVSRGKMYLGIKKGTPNICVPANIILYLPSSEIDKADTAINLMKETSYDFGEVSYSCVLQRITEMIPGAYLFHYYVKDSMCCLVVYGRKSDTLFEDKFCENYDEKAVPIYRIGL